MAKEKFDIETGGMVPVPPQAPDQTETNSIPAPPPSTGTYADDVKPSKNVVLAGLPVAPTPPDAMPVVGGLNSLAHRIGRFMQTAIIHHHEKVHEVMAKYGLPTDDSVRLVVGSDPAVVLEHDDVLHDHVDDGQKVTVAPAASLKK